MAVRMWLGPSGGCVQTKPHPTTGEFACWGDNAHNQLGDGLRSRQRVASRWSPGGASVPTSFALGSRLGCGAFADRRVRCWGDGAGEWVPADLVAGGDDAVRLKDVGEGSHLCVRQPSGTITCMSHDAARLGDASHPLPRQGGQASDFSVGASHVCAIVHPAGGATSDGSWVECRGTGPAAPLDALRWAQTPKQIVSGDAHACVLLSDHSVRCWGANSHGELGDGTRVDSATPALVSGVTDAKAIVAGRAHTCILRLNGTVACWGDGGGHQLLRQGAGDSVVPQPMVGLLGIQELVAARDGTCVRFDGGYVRCWGNNEIGQLGDGTTEPHPVPVNIRYGVVSP